jgi:hypothetical protein
MAAAALVAAVAPSGMAATRATPETLTNLVRQARPGDSITLAPGEYRNVRISKCHFDPAITLDASKATFYGLLIADCDGVTIRGGEFRLPPPVISPRTGEPMLSMALRSDRSENISVRDGRFIGPGHPDTGDGFAYGEGYGFMANRGQGFVVEDSSFTGFEASVVFYRADNFRVSRITSTAARSDGIDIAESHHGVVEYVKCSGTVIRDKEHPDCIQGWSQKGSVPTSDIIIRHVSVVGDTQGINFFNHASIGQDTGGFDRITIEDNDVEVSYAAGITLDDGRDSIVRRNHVRTLGKAKNRATLRTTGAKACGNVVEPGAGKPGYSDGDC